MGEDLTKPTALDSHIGIMPLLSLFFLILLGFLIQPVFSQCAVNFPADLELSAARIQQHIDELSRFGRNPEGGVSRLAFSRADIEGRRYVAGLMEAAGLTVSVDAAGNLIGRRPGLDNDLPPILFGSHIDSVPHGGNYDGDVGVMAAIEAAQVLDERGVQTCHPLEVVVFTDEEGGLVGSRAMAGALGPEALQVVSHAGMTVAEGIRALGGDPDRLDSARRNPSDVKAFLEVHIEQGAVLDESGIDIGVVEGIVGINWWDVTIEGFANHAGTTPMDRRRDALLAAAKLIIEVNEIVTGTPGRQVGTVGRIDAHPGAPNVIPGKVVMSLELRDLSSDKIRMLFQRIQETAERIAQESQTTIDFAPIDATAVPAPTDVRIRKLIAESAQELGLTSLHMPSGAGHDAQNMARSAPTGMIFVPSKEGVSHSPDEFTSAEGMANGAAVLLRTILKIDQKELQ